LNSQAAAESFTLTGMDGDEDLDANLAPCGFGVFTP
jgi:hypothetical protein